jgi:cytidylate kinase
MSVPSRSKRAAEMTERGWLGREQQEVATSRANVSDSGRDIGTVEREGMGKMG